MNAAIPKREGDEVWELTTPGRVHIAVTNHLGRPADVSAVGKGSRLRLTTLDRQLAEEGARKPENNPFRNGMLIQVVGTNDGDESNSLNDQQMTELFALPTAKFEKVLEDLSELNIRRLKAMSVIADAAASQIRALDELLETKYRVGGAMPSYEEMLAQPK